MLARDLDHLDRAVRDARWRDGSDVTQTILQRSGLDPQTTRRIDATWATHTDGRFGFSAQVSATGAPPPPGGGPEAWEYAIRVGELVGWRPGRWACWADEQYWSTGTVCIATTGPAAGFPPGCFPFHDAMTDMDWRTGFSPRDCWGEGPWERWCAVWRAVG